MMLQRWWERKGACVAKSMVVVAETRNVCISLKILGVVVLENRENRRQKIAGGLNCPEIGFVSAEMLHSRRANIKVRTKHSDHAAQATPASPAQGGTGGSSTVPNNFRLFHRLPLKGKNAPKQTPTSHFLQACVPD